MNRKLAFLPLLALFLLPLAQVQAQATPGPLGKPTLTLGELKGTIKEDNLNVVPYKGNATVTAHIVVPCALFAYEAARNGGAPGLHLEVAGKAPTWLTAEDVDVKTSSSDGSKCASGSGNLAYDQDFAFSVSAAAPAILQQTFNLTANMASDDVPADAQQVIFAVQFHGNYTLTPSVQFPMVVHGNQANFTVTLSNTGNSRSMIMVEETHASTGSFSGLSSQVYLPPQTVTVPVSFKAPSTCWTNATVTFSTATHYLTVSQLAGSYKDVRHYTWEFTNGDSCKGSSKASPLGGWVLIASVLGSALLARRRQD